MNTKFILSFMCLLCFWSHSTGQASFVIGNSMAPGEFAIAGGDSSQANGNTSLALGKNAMAIGDFSIALGERSVAEGTWSMSAGFGSRIESPFSLGFGFFNSVPPDAWFATAIGAANEVTSWGGVALGRDNIANGASASVLGTRSYARSYGETVLGAYGEDYVPNTTDPMVWHPEDRVFVVASGWGDGNEPNDGNGFRQNALVMLKNGNTTLNGNLDIRNRVNIGEDIGRTPREGDVRFNPKTKDFEGYTGNMWVSLTNPGMANQHTIAETGNWTPSIGNQLAFLKITSPNIDGESMVADHINEIEIIGLSLSQSNPNFQAFGQGIILKKLDRSTITLLEHLHSKQNAPSAPVAEIEIFRQTGGPEGLRRAMKYTLEGMRIISYDHKILTAEDMNTDRFKIKFNCIKIEHFDSMGNSTGDAETWNFINNQESFSPACRS